MQSRRYLCWEQKNTLLLPSPSQTGRALDEGQISAVVHLASAVAGLRAGNVTLVVNPVICSYAINHQRSRP
ncbi:hypothetical protein KCP78_08955 [Salmonella enterica subsp. enterica]|nr:hypothetical protein KCP78_08955 [Salmonella enterica subsp. enterica]